MWKKRGFEFTFVWIFAIIVGAVIIFLALFASKRLVSSESAVYNSEVAAQLGAIFSPIETNLETSKYYKLNLPGDTRITNKCFTEGSFGKQEISLSVKSGIGKDWQSNGVPYTSTNKYVFSSNNLEASEIDLFIKPIYMPYKVGDMIIMYSSSYCFVAAPEFVKEDIESLGLRGVNISMTRGNCPRNSITVCFSGGECNISVVTDNSGKNGYVKKKGQNLYYIDSLMYGAIFSDPAAYNCQVERLRKRAAELAYLYADKSSLLNTRGCTNSFGDELKAYASELNEEARNLAQISSSSDLLENENEKLSCRIF